LFCAINRRNVIGISRVKWRAENENEIGALGWVYRAMRADLISAPVRPHKKGDRE